MQDRDGCSVVGRVDSPARGATPKGFTVGTHRVFAPEEMLARIKPLLAQAGVTRLADITGLDRIGLPVYSAIRPTGKTLSVAAGKGLTKEAAMVSAAMEAIEVFHAETVELPIIRESFTRLWSSCACDREGERAVAPLDELPLRAHAIGAHPERQIEWTWGRDLLTGGCTAVPVDLVTVGHSNDPLTPFRQTSNGLASGAVYVEALLAALLELIERDSVARRGPPHQRGPLGSSAVARTHAAAEERESPPRVRLESLDEMPLLQSVLSRLADAEVQPILYDCMQPRVGIPVYLARVWDARRRHVGVYRGSGAHLDPEIAVLRALTEAIQSRAVYLSGARDDLFGREFAQLRAQDSPAVIRALQAQPAIVDARNAPNLASDTFEQDIDLILERLGSRGVRHVVAFDLTLPEFRDHLTVVRVVVPGLIAP